MASQAPLLAHQAQDNDPRPSQQRGLTAQDGDAERADHHINNKVTKMNNAGPLPPSPQQEQTPGLRFVRG
eukprot:gene34436-50698_t